MDDVVFVRCPECGNEQADMGNHVTCEECGFGPMPTVCIRGEPMDLEPPTQQSYRERKTTKHTKRSRNG